LGWFIVDGSWFIAAAIIWQLTALRLFRHEPSTINHELYIFQCKKATFAPKLFMANGFRVSAQLL